MVPKVESILAKALGHEAGSMAAEKRDLLARLLGRVAHEIRNPLSSLDIHVQLLEEDLAALAPASREKLGPRLEIIHGELHRLERLVENFLRLAGPSELDLEPTDVVALVRHVCGLLKPEAVSRGAEIHAEVDGPIPALQADAVRLTQALLNLAINALQAVGSQGRVLLAVASENEAILVRVRDNGSGIPPEELPVIFDPYYTTKKEGHGLGLWIAQQIATAHGGKIVAQNIAGGGAEFVLSLPLRRSAALNAGAAVEPGQPAE